MDLKTQVQAKNDFLLAGVMHRAHQRIVSVTCGLQPEYPQLDGLGKEVERRFRKPKTGMDRINRVASQIVGAEVGSSGLSQPDCTYRMFLRTCFIALQEYDEARKRLIAGSQELVNRLAKQFRGQHCPLTVEDLTQEGMMGVLKAVDRFDPNHKTSFRTYAYHWIVSAIQKALREHGLIHVPRMRTTAKSDRPHIVIHSLNAPADGNGDAREELIDFLVDRGEQSPEEQVILSETKGVLEAFMKRVLSPEEKDALCQYYQLDGADTNGEDPAQSSKTILALCDRALSKLRLASLPEKERLLDYYQAGLN